MPGNTDPYTYPGTDVLRNILHIRNLRELAVFEADSTSRRLAELYFPTLRGCFDIAHFRAVHKHIFQDVFEWAGEFRTVNISKGGNFFGAAAFIGPALASVLQKLAAEDSLRQTGASLFAARAGYYLGEINAIHPFREGNGRTQREFIRELAVEAGIRIDWTRTSRERMIAASRASFKTGDTQPCVAGPARKCTG